MDRPVNSDFSSKRHRRFQRSAAAKMGSASLNRLTGDLPSASEMRDLDARWRWNTIRRLRACDQPDAGHTQAVGIETLVAEVIAVLSVAIPSAESTAWWPERRGWVLFSLGLPTVVGEVRRSVRSIPSASPRRSASVAGNPV